MSAEPREEDVLIEAVGSENIAAIENLLKNGADVHLHDDLLLRLAAEMGSPLLLTSSFSTAPTFTDATTRLSSKQFVRVMQIPSVSCSNTALTSTHATTRLSSKQLGYSMFPFFVPSSRTAHMCTKSIRLPMKWFTKNVSLLFSHFSSTERTHVYGTICHFDLPWKGISDLLLVSS